MELLVLSIDIGIINLGYVFAKFTLNKQITNYYKKVLITKEILTNNINIISCDRVNITNVKHSRIPICDCKLYHERCIPDYLDHFIQEHNNLFEMADTIIIERQPPVGITNVQDLLFTKFRSKVILISPNSVHKFFNMSKDYDIRKIESEKISHEYLKNHNKYLHNTRKHDISDAMLMLLYHYSSLLTNQLPVVNNFVDIIHNFEQFRL